MTNGRYRAELTDNSNNKTLHFNGDQGRLDATTVHFPFEFIARNIGIGTLNDSQTAPPNYGQYGVFNFSGVQIHNFNLNTPNYSHVVIGHRGETDFTIEAKNTINGTSKQNDNGANSVPLGRADLRIVGDHNKNIQIFYQHPNLNWENSSDNWLLYNGSGKPPEPQLVYDDEVYIGLITYAYFNAGVPFVGTCDSIQITQN